MNDRAKELGCTNTVFTNPTGLPDDNQHTTAHDLALIMQAAISNDSFRTISGATSYTIPATNVSGGTRNLTSSFTMTDPASASYYEGCIGGRESTTTASGSVLVTAAQRNGTTLIAVVMNGATGQTANEAISLLDYGFSNFQLLDLSEDDFHILSGLRRLLPRPDAAHRARLPPVRAVLSVLRRKHLCVGVLHRAVQRRAERLHLLPAFAAAARRSGPPASARARSGRRMARRCRGRGSFRRRLGGAPVAAAHAVSLSLRQHRTMKPDCREAAQLKLTFPTDIDILVTL